MIQNRKARRRAATLARRERARACAPSTGFIRAAALGTAAAGAMLVGYGRTAQAGPDACITVGNVATCQGNQSAGITNQGGTPDFTTPPVDTLNVNTLNQAIAPGTGVDGVEFLDGGAATGITVTIDTGPFGISTNGGAGYANGIEVRESGDGDVSIISTGNITTNGTVVFFRNRGIDAYERDGGNLSVVSTGDITTLSGGRGISAFENDDGNLTITSTGDIRTFADDRGISAEEFDDGNLTITSIGDITTYADDRGIDAAESGAGDLTITSIGDIRTLADDHGISADEVGTGDLTITSTGDITTVGDNDAAIYAYERDAGDATVTSTGNLTASGANATGVNVVVDAGTISTVTLSGGTVQGGPGNGAGVDFSESAAGSTNTLNTSLTNLFALSGIAVRGGDGDETVNNTGTVTGDILLGGGTNAFNNNGGGLFNAGAVVNLGAGNPLHNAGTLSPGGVGALQTTALTGNLTQTATGIFTADADLGAGTSDLVNVSGTATLSGNALAQVVNPADVAQQTTILSAAGGTTNNGLGLLSSPALQAQLLFPNATDVDLAITGIDFLAPGATLNPNQTNVASNLNAILGAGGGTVGPVLLALLNGVTDIPAYLNALDQLIPEGYLNTEATSLFAAEEFNSNLLSCPQAGDGYTAVSQGQCMWVRYDGRWADRDGTSRNIGYEEDAHGISGGGQVAVAPNWFVGIAAAYEDSDLDTNANASAATDRYMLGGVIKYQSGPAVLALAGSFGSGDVDMARRINIGGFNATARSSFDVDHVGATFHAAYLMDRSSWYAKPFVDVNVTHVDRESARETGGDAANLNVSGSDETYFSVTPALELGTTIDRGDGRAIRPYVRAGVTFYGDTDQSLTASFAGAPAGVGGFTTTSEFDDIFADIEAGVTLFHGDQHTVSAGYEGRFSDDTDVHGFFVKGTRTF